MVIDSYSGTMDIIKAAFDGKIDKAGEPYIEHLKRVEGGVHDYPARIVALLHDLLEDCSQEWTEERLCIMYSDDIVDAVVCLTRLPHENYDDYIQRIKTNRIAIDVKLADLRDNMDTTRLPALTDKDILRLRKYHKAYIELKNCRNAAP